MSGLDTIIDKLASTSVEDEREVSFAGRGLKLDTEEDAQEVVEAIRQCSDMTTLRLEGNTIGVQAAKAIAKALESQHYFRKALWKDMFTRRTENEIPEALNFLSSGIILANAHLVELDLSDNAFGPRGTKGIVHLLKSPPCYTLKELRLNNNGLGISGAKMLAKALSQCLENSNKEGKPLRLKLFICGRNRLENEGSLALSGFLKDAKTLEYIAMPQNGIYHPGIAGLTKAFAANTGLKVLNLEDNSITEEGAKHIADVLPSLKNLEIINFGDCLLRTGGAKCIAKVLKTSCPNLKELILGYNEIRKEGGFEIINAVQNKSNLEKLVLNGNQFGSEGCEVVKEMMASINKVNCLSTLSDDESSDDEDSDEEKSQDDENSDGSADEKETNVTEENNFSHRSPMLEHVHFSDFFCNPTGEQLLQLYQSGAGILPELPENPTFKDHFNLFLKISSVVKTGDGKVEEVANHYADQLLSAAFKICAKDEMWKFNNDFLVCLGLIKAEDKKIEETKDLTGALILLKHAVKNNYFQSSTRDLLKLILSRPLRSGNATQSAITELLKTLYQP